jgi:hypothetical protein
MAIANAYSAHLAAVLPAPMLSAAQTPWGITSPSLVESLLQEEERASRQKVAASRASSRTRALVGCAHRNVAAADCTVRNGDTGPSYRPEHHPIVDRQ